jgi:hypothetical protein
MPIKNPDAHTALAKLARPKNIGASEYTLLYDYVADLIHEGESLDLVDAALAEIIEYAKNMRHRLA